MMTTLILFTLQREGILQIRKTFLMPVIVIAIAIVFVIQAFTFYSL